MSNIESIVNELNPQLQKEVEDFAVFLLEKQKQKVKNPLKLDWRGALNDMRDKYTSVELQHKLLDWW